MKKSYVFIPLLGAFMFVIVATGAPAQETSINLDLARQYFNELNSLCRQDEGRLWGVDLCGPTLLVNEQTRDVVSNHADRDGFLTKKNELFVGKWPLEMNIANTAVEWKGTKWTMMIWPLPGDPQDRAALMLHELFHRVQGDLKLPGANPSNGHLDTRDARVWLQLEWRALANALMERGVNRKRAIADALAFREYRHQLFPQAAKDEKALEMNEGLAEYTGLKMSSSSNAEFALRAGCALRQARNRPTFVRSFAYLSGPAYGALLDDAPGDWRKKLSADGDLAELLRRGYLIKVPQISREMVVDRAARYHGVALIAAETARDNTRQELLKKYRARFLDQPVLTLPLSDAVQYSFNPNNLVPLDENSTVYPTTRVTDEWGILEVSDGALLIREAGRAARIVVAPPNDLNERPLRGPGWELQLKEGWQVVPAERKGSVVLKRTASPVSGGGTATEVLRMAREIAAAAGAEIWPGFEINRYGSLFTDAGSTLIRFTNGPDSASGQVFMSIGDDYFQQHSLDEGLSITFHEAFHGFERDRNREGAKWRTENSMLFSEYPDSASISNALFSIEGKILYSALDAPDRSTLKTKAREFIAVRKLRQSGLEARFVEYEKGAESNEGLAEYAGSKAVVAAIEGNNAKKTNIPLPDRNGQTYLLRKFENLKSITRIGKNSRLRFYYTGAAQAFLLDRLMSNWKSKVQSKGTALQDLVEEAAEYSPVAGETARILAQYGHPTILQEEEAASAKTASERQALLDSILNQPGRKYVIDVSALSKMGAMRGFDPMNAILIGKQKRVHTRFLNVGQDGVYEAQFSQPVVEDPENLVYTTISKADQKQEIVVDGELLEPGKFVQKRFEKKLTIVSTGFNFEARAGVVKITHEGIFVAVSAPK